MTLILDLSLNYFLRGDTHLRNAAKNSFSFDEIPAIKFACFYSRIISAKAENEDGNDHDFIVEKEEDLDVVSMGHLRYEAVIENAEIESDTRLSIIPKHTLSQIYPRLVEFLHFFKALQPILLSDDKINYSA